MKKYVNITGKNRLQSLGYWLVLAMVMVLSAVPNPVNGESHPDQGFIYGRIHMEDGGTYEGPIRWGTEEALWHDLFNSSKNKNEFSVYLSSKELREIREKSGRRGFLGFLERIFTRRRGDDLITHQFVCRFGELKRMEMKGRSTVRLTFKKDGHLEVTGGSNDINTRINVIDREAGELSLKWGAIRSIEFMPVPQPLAGKIKTKEGKSYAGRIVYDLDEAMDFEILSGEHEGIEYHIPFRNIDSIVPAGGCCSRVTLKNGTVVELEKERDVNRDNDGLLVWDDAREPVYIPWRKIKEIKM
jgi:hypothetical protein